MEEKEKSWSFRFQSAQREEEQFLGEEGLHRNPYTDTLRPIG